MARETINRCIWLVDTIRRYGRVTRRELDDLWTRSALSDGQPISRRTFYNYRDMVEEMFNLRIECDISTYEYYIAQDSDQAESMANWMLNTMSLNNMLTGSRDVADRIFVEDIPSAREHLGIIIEALKGGSTVKFNYHSYTRALPTSVVIEPYFVKLFKQRWYLIGRVVAEDRIKTYALDRMKDAVVQTTKFEMPADFDPVEFYRHSYGIVVTQSDVRKVVLRVDPRQAKYFAALPLHPSQSQTLGNGFSLFTMHVRITDDFVEELLSHGSRVTVLEPPELRARMKKEFTEAARNYD